MKRLIFLLSIIMGSITGVSCNVHSNPNDSISAPQPNDSTKSDTAKAVINSSDSIFKMLQASKKIKCENLTTGHKHEHLRDSVLTLSQGEAAIVKFLLDDETNRSTNYTAYGNFSPLIRITCIQSRKKTVTALFDFGLHKWQLLDAKGEKISTYDFSANEALLAKFFCRLFPEDETLKAYEQSLTEK